MDLRVLFVGFEKDEIPKCNEDEYFKDIGLAEPDGKYYSYKKDLPTFYDYHLVFLRNPNDIPQLSYEDYHTCFMRDKINEKKEEISELFKSGGILFTFLFPKVYDNYGWLPSNISFRPIKKHGDTVIPLNTCFKNILKNNDFCYMSHFDRELLYEDKDTIIATNIHGMPISIYKDVNKGTIIFLPQYKQAVIPKQIIRELVDVIRKNFIEKPGKKSKSIPPTWLQNHKLPNEEKYLKEINVKETILSEYNTIKQSLYETGENLVYSVGQILKKFGFKVKIKEKEGIQDIEIQHEEFLGIIEIKGKEKYANVDDLRQLLNWYVDSLSENEEKDIKPIFIINHYRNKNIKERKEPYTEKAIQLGENNKFCLMTTYDLFSLYIKFINKQISLSEIEKIMKKNGVVNIDI
jgi:uncharacterized protein YqgQ